MRRLVCLDGLRGVLAFYVMLSHSLPFAPLPHWLHWMFQHGGAGVDVFFVLSGLVIVQSLASFEYQALPFLIARVARIYPVFLVVFLLAVAVQPLATSFEDMAWIGPESGARYLWAGGWPSNWGIGIATHLTMTHGLFPDGVLPGAWVAFLGTAWSLSTEWQFYVLALLLGHRLGLVRMATLFLALAAASLIWQVAMPEAWQFSRAFLPNKAQYFALGVVSAIVVREEPRCAAALRGGTGRRARAVPVTGRVRQAAAATALDGVPCRAALVVSTARWTARGPGARFGTADYQVVGRTSAVSAASLARGRLVLHLPGARARAASPRHSACVAGARRRPVVHRTLDTRSRGSAGSRGVVAPWAGGVACAALRARHGACLHQRRTNVQNCGTRPSRRALDS